MKRGTLSTLLTCLGWTALIVAFQSCPSIVIAQDTTFFEGFESGSGSWYATNGVWEVGVPSTGPGSAHSGQNCAGTILGGNYPDNANTRLVSPQIALPSGHVQLKFWHWFSIEDGYDQGVIQVSTDNGISWQTLTNPEYDGNSGAWTQACVDLSSYAGSTVRIGFYFTSNWNATGSGWYVDDVCIEVGPETFPNPEDFETGIGDWGADNGLWEVGVPTAGPSSAHSGQSCVGTVLGGNYADNANTRLVSPQIALIPRPGQSPELFFWQWHSMENGYDWGQVQVSVNGGPWQTVPGYDGHFTGSNPTWSQSYVPLSAFADSTARIGFYFASNWNATSSGWYIDDVRIEGIEASEAPISASTPKSFALFQNYPNPFNSATAIEYQLPAAGQVSLTVYDILGRQVVSLANGHQTAGPHSVVWDAQGIGSGTYFYRITASKFTDAKRCVILK